MKFSVIPVITSILLMGFACQPSGSSVSFESVTEHSDMEITTVTHPAILSHAFLSGMYEDDYFPDFLVDKSRDILLELCSRIEKKKPATVDDLYVLTHAATEKFNELDEEFGENGSELETVARELIAEEFEFIAKTYGYDADVEEMIAPRDW